ncbi:MAG TPA: CotH kinase family protein, partial [Verrucomicrobiae bacterium]|nr:CotH kinase family protein [Verrucomicrobiae bacterium]
MRKRLSNVGLLAGAMVYCLAAQAKVVINEIFYHAPADLAELQYIELFNDSPEPVSLGGWQFTKGIRFTFPAGARVAGGGYVVVCRNRELFEKYYPVEVAGVFDTSLKHSGQRIELEDASGKLVDRVRYADHEPWPQSPDGWSASLERVSPSAVSDLANNWESSPLSPDPGRPGGSPGRRNTAFSAHLPPMIGNVQGPGESAPAGQPIEVRAEVFALDGLREVRLRYRLAGAGFESAEISLPMVQQVNQHYAAAIPGQSGNQIVRYRVEAIDSLGTSRFYPGTNEPRPAFSCFVRPELPAARIPFALVFHTTPTESLAGKLAGHFQNSSPVADAPRRRLERGLRARLDLSSLWAALTLDHDLSATALAQLRLAFADCLARRDQFLQEALASGEIRARLSQLPARLKAFRAQVRDACQAALDSESAKFLDAWLDQASLEDASLGRPATPDEIVEQIFPVASAYAALTTRAGLAGETFDALRKIFREAAAKQSPLLALAKKLDADDRAGAELEVTAKSLFVSLVERVNSRLTPDQSRAFAAWRAAWAGDAEDAARSRAPVPVQGHAAVVYIDPAASSARVFDFVTVMERGTGFKVHFHKDRPLDEMTTVNFTFSPDERFMLAEDLAYELYHRSGNAAPRAGFVRLWMDGEPLGYHLFCEQPNKAFLRRYQLRDDGNLYQADDSGVGLAGQHEKRANSRGGYDDLTALVEALANARENARWQVIQNNFDTVQVATYFALALCLSDFEGFRDNYFAYHDVGETGKWQLFPWEQGKTWGYRGDLGPGQVFCELPVTHGMEGDVSPGGKNVLSSSGALPSGN